MTMLSRSVLSNMVGPAYKYKTLMRSASDELKKNKNYDVFLSHSALDGDTILQLNFFLEDVLGLTVFVYWIECSAERNSVTPATAAELRNVMDRCSSLLYAISANSSSSKWMPWELGYSDATHGHVAVLPIADQYATAAAYRNQEFVGIYPLIDVEIDNVGKWYLSVKNPRNLSQNATLTDWISSNSRRFYP